LAGQPAPYGEFFVGLERVLHDHGPITMQALIDELRRGHSDADAADDGLRLLLDRLTTFHDVADDETPEVLLEAMLLNLRKQAIADELNWLTESGDLSEEATARRNALIHLRAELKRGTPAGTGAR
jgi:DNA primase